LSLQAAIKAKVDALQNVPDAWAKGVMRLQPSILARLQRLASELATDEAGRIVMDVANLARVDEIIGELQRFITRSEYRQLIAGLADEFALQQGRTVAYFAAATGEVPPISGFAAARYAQASSEALRNIAVNVPTQRLVEPIRQAMLEGIATGSGYTDLLTNLQGIITGTDSTEGYLLRYSRQIVSDSLAVTDREFTRIVAEDLGLEWYLYAGGEMDTTRCFCDERNGKYYHFKEIQAWGRGEDVGPCGYPWAGMFTGTNESTIFAYVGGYNCQHSLLPVSESIVPDSDLARAKAKGYI
jgi:hypothetical protein